MVQVKHLLRALSSSSSTWTALWSNEAWDDVIFKPRKIVLLFPPFFAPSFLPPRRLFLDFLQCIHSIWTCMNLVCPWKQSIKGWIFLSHHFFSPLWRDDDSTGNLIWFRAKLEREVCGEGRDDEARREGSSITSSHGIERNEPPERWKETYMLLVQYSVSPESVLNINRHPDQDKLQFPPFLPPEQFGSRTRSLRPKGRLEKHGNYILFPYFPSAMNQSILISQLFSFDFRVNLTGLLKRSEWLTHPFSGDIL